MSRPAKRQRPSRAHWIYALIFGACFIAPSAYADIAPSPTRPNWDEEPPPNPRALVVGVALGAALAFAAGWLFFERARARVLAPHRR